MVLSLSALSQMERQNMQLIAVAPYTNLDMAMVDLVYRVGKGRYVLRAGVHALSEDVEDEPLSEFEFIRWAAIVGANLIPVPVE